MDMVEGEEGEGEMYGESNMEIFNAICKIADGNLLYDSGNSNRGSTGRFFILLFHPHQEAL